MSGRRRHARLGGALAASAVVILLGIGLSVARDPARPPATGGGPPGPTRAGVPLSFEPNVGQADRGVRFLGHGPGGPVDFTARGAVISLGPADVLTLAPAHARPDALVSAAARLRGRVNYLIGPRAAWHAGVATYGQVVYHSVYPGIDLRYDGGPGQVEYRLDLAAGADPSRIALDLGGTRGLRLDAGGNLLVGFADRTLVQRAPAIYQERGGIRRPVRGGFVLLGPRRVGFAVGPHDRSAPLVIDPTIEFSTQLVGSAPGEALGVAVDRAGATYVTGGTSSANFPTVHPLHAQAKATTENAFVAKLDRSGALIYATYLGGSRYTQGRGIAVDSTGAAFVTGATNSTDFPATRSGLQRSYGGGPFDAFVTKLNPAGSGLVYSTFLGSTHYDEGNAIAVDPVDRAVITGKTASPDFPRVHPLAPFTTSGAFVSKLDRAGTRLVSSTSFGGTGAGNHADSGFGIAVDRVGNTYVTGETNDPGFPTVAALQPGLAGGGNAFAIKLDAASSRVLYATYLGGAGNDIGRAIAADNDGNAYLAGQTTSRNFPTANPIQAGNASPPGGANAFVVKLDPVGGALVYATYLGGSGGDSAAGIAVDRAQNVYVTGRSGSADFPMLSPLQPALHGPADAFVTELDRSGARIDFSTYFGGSGSDAGLAIGLDRAGGIHLTGQTDSTDFPRRRRAPPGPQRLAAPGDGAFVVSIGPRRAPRPRSG